MLAEALLYMRYPWPPGIVWRLYTWYFGSASSSSSFWRCSIFSFSLVRSLSVWASFSFWVASSSFAFISCPSIWLFCGSGKAVACSSWVFKRLSACSNWLLPFWKLLSAVWSCSFPSSKLFCPFALIPANLFWPLSASKSCNSSWCWVRLVL